jgi:hypothetical protein
MYLELSRPRGEVDRWEKVYGRLALFNEFVSFKKCMKDDTFVGDVLNLDQSQFIMNYIIENKRIFAGADLVNFYAQSYYKGKQKSNWLLSTKKPIIFYSPDVITDAKQIQSELSFQLGESGSRSDITIKSFESKGVDLIPSLKIIKQGKKELVYIVQQTSCNSYYNIPVTTVERGLLRIASMDTLITLYFSLGLLDSRNFDIGSIECLANEMVEISVKARRNPERFPFPFISLKCAGHQTSLSSLIRAKVKRITQRKRNVKNLLINNVPATSVAKTVRHNSNKRNNHNRNRRSSKKQVKEIELEEI